MDFPPLVKKARQHLYYLRWLKKFKIFTVLQKSFYIATVESVLSGKIMAQYSNCSFLDSVTAWAWPGAA